jgi:ArsR family transcriptional regulator, lead/cadmium/zinc/bismuth-responsive transcriptional repressor
MWYSSTYEHLLIYSDMTPSRRPLSDASALALADTFKVLGDTTRVRILDALSRSELCVCDIARLVRLSESAVSHQLRLLRDTRLVRTRRKGRRVFYTLDDDHIVGLFAQGLEHVEERDGHRRR